MLFFRRTSPPAQTALAYITVGILTLIWTGVWYLYLVKHPPEREWIFYIVSGLSLTGLALTIIGLAIGHIGRATRDAESVGPDVATNPSADQAHALNATGAAPMTAVPPVQAVPAAQAVPVVPVPAAPPVRTNVVSAAPPYSR